MKDLVLFLAECEATHDLYIRTMAGMARVKATGRNRAGQPVKIGRPKVDPAIAVKVKALRKQGKGINAIARALGIGNSAVSRFLA